MIDNQKASDLSTDLEVALLREMWHVDGRADGLRFAWDCRNDLEQIRSKAKEVEDQIHNPNPLLKDRMTPGASTRIYQDGYLAGLKKAEEIISAHTASEEKVHSASV